MIIQSKLCYPKTMVTVLIIGGLFIYLL